MIEFRAATRLDADAITDVQVAAWRSGYEHVFPESVLWADDFDSSRRLFWNDWRFAPGHRVQVAVNALADDERVLGFSSYGPERDRGHGYTGLGEVWALYVEPRLWGTGLATDFFVHIEERLSAEGFASAVLWVLAENGRARAFYEKLDWEPTGKSAMFTEYENAQVLEVEYRKDLM